jgi:hypothetical protein
MTQSIFLRPFAALVYLTLSGPLLAAQPPAAETAKAVATETGVDRRLWNVWRQRGPSRFRGAGLPRRAARA